MSLNHQHFDSRDFSLKPVTAVLGPTNTGKTHFALERMCAHESGMIGLPLRLLAREVFDKMVARKGARAVALMTGEEKIIPPNAKYWVCTVEAMPLDIDVAFLAIDEVQLAADRERGRIFTHRILHARGQAETLMLGSDTMYGILKRLIPDIGYLSRPRFSQLVHAGSKKISRLPRRTAIVAFSTDAVYSIAELIKRQRGGAAVVMGALSPRTRNAQAALYQEGEVDYLVATDAIGMGLNMDIDHVAFAGSKKYDGKNNRHLFPGEMGQIAGRAGRHIKDGTFGTTGDCPPLNDELAQLIENHEFDPVTALQWRSNALDFTSLPALLRSLEKKPPREELVRARMDDDEDALRRLVKQFDIKDRAKGGAALKLLWEVCQTPDFRKVTPDQHAAQMGDIFRQLLDKGRLPEKWIEPRLERYSRLEGDVDALSHRIAHVRTWTYLTHRAGWLDNATYWQERARSIENALSDKLHEKLSQRFIDRRTSVLLKKLKDDAPLLAGVNADGEVTVEGEFVGRLIGFQFVLDPRAKGTQAKAVSYAALKALQPELAARAAAIATAKNEDFSLAEDGSIWWRQSAVAKLEKGPMALRPNIRLVATEHMPPQSVPRIEDRVREWFASKVEGVLLPLVSLQKAVNMASSADEKDGLSANARGIGFRMVENFGAISRAAITSEVKALEQPERIALRKLGVRFGEFTLFLPALLKPAPAQMLSLLWALWTDNDPSKIEPPKAGLTSIPNNKDLPQSYYYASGYRPSGARAVRIDMLERLAELIRAARQEADMREGFAISPNMMSLVGCSGEDFEGILKSIGLKKNTITKMVPAKELVGETVAATAEPSVPDTEAKTDISQPENSAVEVAPTTDVIEEPTTPTDDEQVEAKAAAPEASEKPVEETASTEPTGPMEEVTLELWKSAPRPQARAPGRPQNKFHGKDAKKPSGKHKGKKDFQGKGKGKPKGPRTYSSEAPRSKKEADPNSPFAALAALKND